VPAVAKKPKSIMLCEKQNLIFDEIQTLAHDLPGSAVFNNNGGHLHGPPAFSIKFSQFSAEGPKRNGLCDKYHDKYFREL